MCGKHPPVASRMHQTGDLAHSRGLCPDQESNHRPSACGTTPNPLSCTSQSYCYFVDGFLCCAKPFEFDVVPLIYCLFVSLAQVDISENILLSVRDNSD